MSLFTKNLVLELLEKKDGGRAVFKVVESFRYYKDREIISVEKGFVTDFTSIPRILWCFLNPIDSRYAKASVLHDYLYKSDIKKTRKECDDIFLGALTANKKNPTPKLLSYFFYFMVRCFGACNYKKRILK